jgi:hypothetical protein
MIMVTVSTKRLMEAIEEADTFATPEMNPGTKYLYENLYNRLAGGSEITLSGLDFAAFAVEDIGDMGSIYDGLAEDERKSEMISRMLWNLSPVTAPAAFV